MHLSQDALGSNPCRGKKSKAYVLVGWWWRGPEKRMLTMCTLMWLGVWLMGSWTGAVCSVERLGGPPTVQRRGDGTSTVDRPFIVTTDDAQREDTSLDKPKLNDKKTKISRFSKFKPLEWRNEDRSSQLNLKLKPLPLNNGFIHYTVILTGVFQYMCIFHLLARCQRLYVSNAQFFKYTVLWDAAQPWVIPQDSDTTKQ